MNKKIEKLVPSKAFIEWWDKEYSGGNWGTPIGDGGTPIIMLAFQEVAYKAWVASKRDEGCKTCASQVKHHRDEPCIGCIHGRHGGSEDHWSLSSL